MDLPLRIAVAADPRIDTLLATMGELASLVQQTRSELMSQTTDLGARFAAAMARLAEEVRETRTGYDAMVVAFRGIKAQYDEAIAEARSRGVQEEHISALLALGDSLDGIQAEMASAAAQNVDPAPAPAPEPAPQPAPAPAPTADTPPDLPAGTDDVTADSDQRI